ncbi:hypothetical protein MXB_4262 [Myxobolus squamalis]|nr:hypothetical protein MXB_4262 [Myxobolus squamalis]
MAPKISIQPLEHS